MSDWFWNTFIWGMGALVGFVWGVVYERTKR